MTHILHVIESLEFGGAEKVLLHLAIEHSREFKVSICLTKRIGELRSEVPDSIQVHFIDAGEGNNWSVPKAIGQIVIDNKIDVIHSHDWGVYLECAFVARRMKGLNWIHTQHGLHRHSSRGTLRWLKSKLRYTLEKIAARYAYRVVCVSNAIAEHVLNELGFEEQKVVVVHNGVTDLNPNACVRQSHDNLVKLVTVGRVAKVKNFPLLLKALSIAHKSVANITLDIIGDGPEREGLEILTAELGLSDKVFFQGFKSNIEEILKNSDIFVLSSTYEGISIALLEAMSVGLPVVVTRVGGIPETVVHEKTGKIVDLGNVENYAEAIVALAESPELRLSYGKAGRARFIEAFHENVVISAYRVLYLKVAV